MTLSRITLSLCLIALVPACRTAPEQPLQGTAETATPLPHLPELAVELLAMAAVDQEVRQELVTFVQENPGQDPGLPLALRMLSIDAKNTARIQAIVTDHGWPTPELVGSEASHAAWLLVQHADSAPDFQATMLVRLEPLLDTGEVERSDYALLTDRVLVAFEKPQRYGTQYASRTVDGVNTFSPATAIEDPKRLDERRRAMGLEPHADYLEHLRAAIAR